MLQYTPSTVTFKGETREKLETDSDPAQNAHCRATYVNLPTLNSFQPHRLHSHPLDATFPVRIRHRFGTAADIRHKIQTQDPEKTLHGPAAPSLALALALALARNSPPTTTPRILHSRGRRPLSPSPAGRSNHPFRDLPIGRTSQSYSSARPVSFEPDLSVSPASLEPDPSTPAHHPLLDHLLQSATRTSGHQDSQPPQQHDIPSTNSHAKVSSIFP